MGPRGYRRGQLTARNRPRASARECTRRNAFEVQRDSQRRSRGGEQDDALLRLIAIALRQPPASVTCDGGSLPFRWGSER